MRREIKEFCDTLSVVPVYTVIATALSWFVGWIAVLRGEWAVAGKFLIAPAPMWLLLVVMFLLWRGERRER